MSMNRHQAVGAYPRWDLPSFDAPGPVPATPPDPLEPGLNDTANCAPPPPALIESAPSPELPPDTEPEIQGGDEELPDHVIAGANRLVDAVPLNVAALLADDEVEAIQGRAAWMVEERRFPTDPTGRRYPWPLV